MSWVSFWRQPIECRPDMLFQQLEERIVLDAAVAPAAQQIDQTPTPAVNTTTDNDVAVNDPVNQPDQDTSSTTTTTLGGSGLEAAAPATTVASVFHQDLNLVLISNALEDVQTLSNAVNPEARVLVFDAEHDTFASITAMLNGLVQQTGDKIDTLVIVTHGAEGSIDLGQDHITSSDFWAYEAGFQALASVLTTDSQIQFYSCDIAGSGLGKSLVAQIAVATGAEVFASIDPVGGTAHDWSLEYSSDSSVPMEIVLYAQALDGASTELGGQPGEPVNTWFDGTGVFQGWDIYNYSEGVYYTKDYNAYWDHKDAGGWTYWNTSAWVTTDTLGNAPYADGYGPVNTWFHDSVSGGTYNGYDVYLAEGSTYFSADHSATAATFWQQTVSGAWSYYDDSAWYGTAGFNVEPANVWFHGYGSDDGWEVYNDSASGDAYYTHDNTLYWWHVSSSNTWDFWNSEAWVNTDALGNAPYDGGYGLPNEWFTATSGSYSGYDVYIDPAGEVQYLSLDHTAQGATYWRFASTDGWSYYDGSAWYTTAGFNVEPVNVWFHGYGTEAGWDVYNFAQGAYYTKDYVVYWNHESAGGWKFYDTATWVATDNLGRAPYDGGYGPYEQIFTAAAGPFNGYEVFIYDGVILYSNDHWTTSTAHVNDGSWWHSDGSNWEPMVSLLDAPHGSTIYIGGVQYYVVVMTPEYVASWGHYYTAPEGYHFVIFGTSDDDWISANDTGCIIFGGAGNDTIHGGAGTDWLFGNAGNDTIWSDGRGNDFIDGGEGNDRLYISNAANITVVGGYGNDTIELSAWENPGYSFTYVCHCGPGNDTVDLYNYYGFPAYFRVYGGSESDTLSIHTFSVVTYSWNEDGDQWPNEYPGLFPWRLPWETGWEYVRWPA